MDISPKIIITGLSLDKEKEMQMQNILSAVQKECSKMGIQIIVPSENFSPSDLTQWIKDIGVKEDFYINIADGNTPVISYKGKKQLKIAKRFSNILSQWTDTEFEEPQTFSKENSSIQKTMSSVGVNAWDITLPNHLTDKEQVFSIMGCITDLYTRKHSLVTYDQVWPFRDVPSSHFAFESIKKAKAKKIIKGYKGDIFQPNGGITRGEVIYMLDKLGLL